MFYKDRHAEFEVCNDINGDLVNLFKCVKYHPSALKEELEFVLNSRKFFDDSKELYQCSALTDIQRASRYLYIIKASYSSNARHFGAKPRDITNAEYLKEIKERLKRVCIENKSFDKLIPQYDKEGTLFYCDPPYYGSEKLYDTGNIVFGKEQHLKLNEVLKNVRGKCIISYNDSDFVRNLYKGFNIEEIERSNNLAVRYNKNKTYKELIIKNY